MYYGVLCVRRLMCFMQSYNYLHFWQLHQQSLATVVSATCDCMHCAGAVVTGGSHCLEDYKSQPCHLVFLSVRLLCPWPLSPPCCPLIIRCRRAISSALPLDPVFMSRDFDPRKSLGPRRLAREGGKIDCFQWCRLWSKATREITTYVTKHRSGHLWTDDTRTCASTIRAQGYYSTAL